MTSAGLQVENSCPFSADHRRSVPGGSAVANATPVTGYAAVRSVLRDPAARQAGFKAELIDRSGSFTRPPILFLSGDAHRRQRAATARFFAPRALEERHRPEIERHSRRLIGKFRAKGAAQLDVLALDLAVSIAAGIIGLTDSDRRGMVRRLDAFFSVGTALREGRLAQTIAFTQGQWRMLRFYLADVRPAIAARRRAPRDDLISHLIAEGYRDRDILVECFTYGAAGMVTTREFVTMAAWHLLENDGLRARFVNGDRADRLTILEEILRLDPVVGTLYRRSKDAPQPVALDIRSANTDAQAVGECPLALDPDRRRADRVGGSGLAFGDGEHRCPGAGVALAEAEIFLDHLLRVPGLRLERAPDRGWNPLIAGYELRDCRIAADAVEA